MSGPMSDTEKMWFDGVPLWQNPFIKLIVLEDFEKVGISSPVRLSGQTLGKTQFRDKVEIEIKSFRNDPYSFYTCHGCDMIQK